MDPSFQTILVANRGVVARRIMRTCRAMGLTPLGIYTPQDQDMRWQPLAERCFAVPSYLDTGAIIALARQQGAAVHPGYGFLSENAAFRRACDQAGVPFIGPSAQVIGSCGDKDACRAWLHQEGVPVIPALTTGQDPASLGFPLLLKPACGGGGIGMAQVHNAEELAREMPGIARQAEQFFGSSEVLAEKYLSPARHIEVQLLGDAHGHLFHLFERECSLQRRHQKVIEESPSPSLSDSQRDDLYTLALQAGRVLGLDNLGTVEFLFHQERFYFLEINPRLQVEHGLTEEQTGLDLVEWQIRLARGESLAGFAACQQRRGHSLEARIYAEDPLTHLPAPGQVAYLALPDGPGLRIESAVWPGCQVPPDFDPLLMKVLATAPTREQARLRLVMALEQLDINGSLRVNTGALLAVLRSGAFRQGDFHTESFAGLAQLPAADNWQELAAWLAGSYQEGPGVVYNKKQAGGFWRPSFWQSNP